MDDEIFEDLIMNEPWPDHVPPDQMAAPVIEWRVKALLKQFSEQPKNSEC